MARIQSQVLAPRGLHVNGLSEREVEVLRLVAEGNDTNEIARTLCYSERTVKNVIHDVTSRLHLRNRPHAVAFALRQGPHLSGGRAAAYPGRRKGASPCSWPGLSASSRRRST